MVDQDKIMDKFTEPETKTYTLSIGRRLADLIPALEMKKREVVVTKVGLYSGKPKLISKTRINAEKGSSYLTESTVIDFGSDGHLRFKLRNMNELFAEHKQLLMLLVKNMFDPDDIWITKMVIYDRGKKTYAEFRLDEPKTMTEKQLVEDDSTRLKMQLDLKRIHGTGIDLSYDEKAITKNPTHYTKDLLVGFIPNIYELTTCIPNSPVLEKICIHKYPKVFKKEKTTCELPIRQDDTLEIDIVDEEE